LEGFVVSSAERLENNESSKLVVFQPSRFSINFVMSKKIAVTQAVKPVMTASYQDEFI
jgi:hypothetical protein